ncbi:insulin-like receptor isoform X1 [Vespula squamosa]|uniref:receptor protein-tyrosine kinase n=1 Tax=Vespula squamosa TaxID=30214 RepID=A0ABD1ZV12_VESSQ
MMHLQEIGLHSLTDILRGSVRFEKNPALCYVDTIDWDVIAKAGKGEHVISGNKPKNGCPICEKNCTTRLTKPDETLCWNRQHCQRICDKKCGEGSCDATNRCCHPSCLGGCTGLTANNCKVCKNVLVGGSHCQDRCPNGTYEFMNRRCIGEDECRQMVKPREALSIVKDNPYKPFNGSCIIECPAGYMDEEIDNKTSCRKCKGPCLKECAGTSVDSIASAQKLRGCTHITGSLEIQIRGGKNIVNELEDSLNMIEEIDGYLKIVRSFPLISLNFLKSLRVIRGNYLDNSKYTLAVLDNQNLQELWDWSTHGEISILSKDGPAKVFFHFNPKLCFHKIETLREKARLEQFSDLEVAPNSNGDKVACNVTELKTIVTKTTSDAALIEWEQFTHHDPRSLLGYVVYFIEAPNENVTMYDGRDACGGDGWRVDDVSAIEGSTKPITTNYTELEKPSYLSHILTQLKPFTQYAFYVKTYTIATERSGAQSKVTYFTTKPHAPSAPRGLSTYSNSSSELIVSWLPPLRKNGNLTHYRIVGRWVPDDSNFIDQRNYCDEPMSLPEKKSMSVMAEEERKRAEEEKELAKIPETTSCDCADRELDQSMREKEVSSSIAFEDALHNQVYVKRIDARRRRDTSEIFEIIKKRDHYSEKESTADKIVNDTYIVFDREVPSPNLSFVMKNLRHFAYYNIEVQACREVVKNDTNDTCSTKSMKTYRTLPLDSADNIPANTFRLSISGENNSLTTVTLYWAEPPQPNGLIVTYQIEYKRVDIQNIKATVVCITRRDFTKAGNSYVLKDLPAGNYSIKVRATSLAGNGNYTEAQYFFIKEYSSLGLFWILFWSILCSLFAVMIFVVFYVLRYVIEGGVMERPENCPDSLYNLMRRTWCHKATRRPTFIDIATILLSDVNLEAFERVSFYHSPEGIEARNQNISHSPQTDKDLEMTTLQDLREEEVEGEEDSPLRQDFGDFASFEPTSIKNSLSPRYTVEPYGENSKTTTNFHDMNSSKVPLKAGFDDFDGISGDSLASSKDTLNLPFVEDSLKSVKNSPYIHAKNTSRGNVSQTSTARSTSPQSLIKQQQQQQQRTYTESPNSIKFKSRNPDYENSSPEILANIERKPTIPSQLELSSVDTVDIGIDIDKKDGLSSTVEYVNKPETLNNGYIGGNNTTT